MMDRDFRLKKRRENELDPEILVRILRQTAGEEEAAKLYAEWTCPASDMIGIDYDAKEEAIEV